MKLCFHHKYHLSTELTDVLFCLCLQTLYTCMLSVALSIRHFCYFPAKQLCLSPCERVLYLRNLLLSLLRQRSKKFSRNMDENISSLFIASLFIASCLDRRASQFECEVRDIFFFFPRRSRHFKSNASYCQYNMPVLR